MTRALPLMLTALSLAGASCQPQAGGLPESGAPVVGRLQFQDRLIELTIDSFADVPNAVPKNAQAHLIADIIEAPRADPAESANGIRSPRALP